MLPLDARRGRPFDAAPQHRGAPAQVFMVAPLLSHLIFARDFVPSWINSEEEGGGRKNAGLSTLFVLLTSILVLFVLYVLLGHGAKFLIDVFSTGVRRSIKRAERRYFGY